MRHIFAGLLILIMVSACETIPEKNWAQGQTLYNGAIDTINTYREPCVEWSGVPNAGPNHPQCYISDAAMIKIAPIRNAADALLREMDAAAIAGDDLTFQRLMLRLEPLVMQLVTEAAAARQEKLT